MDDQRDEILVHRSRADLDSDAARFEFERPGVRPADVVSNPSRRSWLRRFFWVLLVLAMIGAAVWYYPRPEPQPKTGGRNQGPAPLARAAVAEGGQAVRPTRAGPGSAAR